MSRKKKKVYNPPPKPHQNVTQIPKKLTSYYLLNPSFPVEVVYQILSNASKSKEPMMMIKGKPEDFANDPSIMFRKVEKEINFKEREEKIK